mmetsp:Transcript_69198/g.205980  ORF Transcript_69198/g.205980 Transcript_69198/m.205980 type:complete len:203 (+) Transcript_69198:90-698(+)
MIPLLTNFAGLPLHMGIFTAFVYFVVRTLIFFFSFSSQEPIDVSGVELGPTTQVAVAALALAGVPASILAAFGALFHMESHVRMLVNVLLATLVVDITFCIVSVLKGDQCTALVDDFLVRRGPMFVCLCIGLASLFWRTAIIGFEAFMLYAVWSQAEQLRRDEFAELLQYEKGMPPAAVYSSTGYGGSVRAPELSKTHQIIL